MAHAEVELPVSRLNDVLAHFGGAAPRNKEDLCFALTAEEVSFRSSAVRRGGAAGRGPPWSRNGPCAN